MSCDGGHLGFPIGIKKTSNLVKDFPMIIHLQFGFSQFISFREEDLWNFSQSEHIIGPGSHIEYPIRTKNSNFVEDHPRNIPAKFGSNRPCGFGEEAWDVKSLQTTDYGRQVMAIVHLDLWSRWTNKGGDIILPNKKKRRCKYLYSRCCLRTPTSRPVIIIHMVVTIHVHQYLYILK